MHARIQWCTALALVAGFACGGDQEPLPAPYPGTTSDSTTSTTDDTTWTTGSTTTEDICPTECPNDCDALGQCRYTINPDARYRVILEQVSVTQEGAKSCTLSGVFTGVYGGTCDLYAVLRTAARDYRTSTSYHTTFFQGGATIPDITLAEIEQYLEVHVIDEKSDGNDVTIAICRPDLTIEVLQIGVVTMQCGVFGSAGMYQGTTALATVNLRLQALDGGALQPQS